MAYKYDKNKDYSKLMQDAANAGNWEQAAIYEQQRNAKIQGEGLSQYQQSQTYARYLPTTYGYNANTDYQKLMDQAAAGGDMARAAIYEQQRNQKIREGNGGNYAMSYQYTDYLPGMSQQVGKTGYKNPYLEQLNASIEKLGDESELKKTYLAQADRQTQDTLGAYAANTGGIASTGAVAAAQQAGANVRSQLGTALMSQRQQYTNALMNASGLAQSDYQLQISEAMNRWQQLGYADDFVSSVLGVAPGTGTSSQNYQIWQQQYQQQQADKQWAANDRNQAYTMAMNILQTGGTPSPELLAAAGIDQNAADQLGGYYQQQQAYQQAMQLLSAGVMPSQEMLAAAGITPAQAQQIQQANTAKGGNSPGGNRRTNNTEEPDDTDEPARKPISGDQYTKLLNAYDKGDGSWINLARGYERDGYDLTDFYKARKIDPANPFGDLTTTHEPSGNVQQLVQQYRAMMQGGRMNEDMLKEALQEKISSGAITVAEAMQIAKALGIDF